jgi:hypothetical protein
MPKKSAKKKPQPKSQPLVPKRGRGQPTKYDPEYCDALVKHLEEGLSFEAFAGVCKVAVDTLYEWMKVHPEFSEAKKIGEAGGRLFWEKVGRAGMTGRVPGFQNAVWIFTMKNRFKWKDRHAMEHTGEDGGPIAQKHEVGLSDNAADFLRRRVLGVKSSSEG